MNNLIELIGTYPRVLVAFSGGADSTLVLYAARQALGRDHVLAVMVDNTMQPQGEAELARTVAEKLDVPFVIRRVDPLQLDAVRMNRRDRCYHCKRLMLNAVKGLEEGYILMDGTNAEDHGEYRPGLRAVEELRVVSPLKVLGYRKSDVRRLLSEYSLPTHEKPPAPCLATRVPYDTELNKPLLATIDAAERAVVDLGYSFCRVRTDGVTARIELPVGELNRTSTEAVLCAVKEFGFHSVTVDPNGYQSGGYDKEIKA